MTRPPTFEGRLAQLRIEKIRLQLTERGMTATELATAICCSRQAAARYIRHLRPHIHVEGYSRVTGIGHRIWRWGIKADAPPPPPLTSAESCARHKAKLKLQQPHIAKERAAKEAERKRIKYRLSTIKPRRDPLVAMFFGAAA